MNIDTVEQLRALYAAPRERALKKQLSALDAPGNNRLDTLENIVATGMVGLLFMIPGVDETLRVNGSAHLSCRRWGR